MSTRRPRLVAPWLLDEARRWLPYWRKRLRTAKKAGPCSIDVLTIVELRTEVETCEMLLRHGVPSWSEIDQSIEDEKARRARGEFLPKSAKSRFREGVMA